MAHVWLHLSIIIADERLLMKRGTEVEKRLGGESIHEVYPGDRESALALAVRNVVVWNRQRPYFDHCGVEVETTEWGYEGPPNYEQED